MAHPLLDVDAIRKSYGRLEALKGVSFQVAEGECFGLLGPNGAGKTTLISILSCLLASSAGQAKLGGQTIRPDERELRMQIGIVPQDLAIYGELTARENLAFFGKLYRMPEDQLHKRVDEVLKTLALADRADDRVSTFSGGMKRRLNLGVGIMHRPRILFLDEPTTGVDPQSRNRIFEEVRRLNRDGMTILYTSHYMEEVQALCTRIGILDQGKLIACDTLPNLLHLLEGQIRFQMEPVPDGLAERLQQMDDLTVRKQDGRGFLVSSRDVPKALLHMAKVFTDLGVEPSVIEAHEPNLERVFLHLTGRGLRD
jgi:ABC-2 type transport system ATP-binding protein